MSENGFSRLQDLQALHWLRAVENKPGAAGIAALGRLPRLQWADLGRCQVEAAWLRPLEGKCVKVLWLYNNPLGDSAMESLAKLPEIQELDVRGCGISKEGIERLPSKLTNTKVLVE